MKSFFLCFFGLIAIFAKAQTIVIDENFETDNKKWPVEKGNQADYQVKKGNYTIKSHLDSRSWATVIYENLDVDADFIIESSVKLKGEPDASYGFMWNLGVNHETYVIIKGNKAMIERYHLKNKNYSNFVDWKDAGISNGKYVKIKIEKKANILSYYINGKLFYRHGNNGIKNFYSKKIGFFVNKKSELAVDYLKITNFPATQSKNLDNYDASIKLEKLETNINSSNEESLPRISPDGNYLYCVRRSKENVGGTSEYDDIWYSKKK